MTLAKGLRTTTVANDIQAPPITATAKIFPASPKSRSRSRLRAATNGNTAVSNRDGIVRIAWATRNEVANTPVCVAFAIRDIMITVT